MSNKNTAQQKLKFFGEVMGLHPLKERYRQAMIAVKGEEDVPPSKAGLSSLQQLHPKISPKLWRGKPYIKRKVIISNLFNHTPTPTKLGWSVAKTQIKDFRNRLLTYNSHNATDFAVPVGTKVCTAGSGKVVAVISEFNRGGLKIFIDHGNGVMTTYAHLARSLVKVGDILNRGDIIALSGYSGLDALISFPFGIPHVHFNVWLDSVPIDPFAYEKNISMWVGGYYPKTAEKNASNTFQPSEYDESKLNEAISNCITSKVKEKLLAIEDIETRAAHTLIAMNYYPTRFSKHISPYKENHNRIEILDLPFSANDFDDIVFIDDLPEMKKFKRWENKLK